MTDIERNGARPTLFVIPGLGGDNPRLAALRSDWSDEFRCVLLEYPDWPQLALPDFGMDDLIEDFVGRIRQQPQLGQLYIAGYSLGGFIAWAIAHRLEGEARGVDTVLVLDADISQNLPPVKHKPLGNRLRRLAGSCVDLLRHGEAEMFSKLIGQFIGYRLVRRTRLLRVLARWRKIPLPRGPRYYLHFSLASELQARIVRSWLDAGGIVARPLEQARVIVFRAAESDVIEDLAGLRRELVCGSLEVVNVAGDHHSFLQLRGDLSLYRRLPEALMRSAMPQGQSRAALRA